MTEALRSPPPRYGIDPPLTAFDAPVGAQAAVSASVPRADEPPMITVTGDIDIDTAPLLHQVLIDALRAHPRVCCDLGGVSFFGAAGANALLAGNAYAVGRGADLTVRGVRGMARRVFEITGLSDLLREEP